MWYFAWVLGVGFAGTFSILNAMWLELDESDHGVTGGDDHSR
jgi:cytochrome bd-I ubiquinol oxidase subunit X